jgi:hypothetical protein
MSIIIIKAQSLREHYFGFEYSEYNLWANKTTSLKIDIFPQRQRMLGMKIKSIFKSSPNKIHVHWLWIKSVIRRNQIKFESFWIRNMIDLAID